MVKVKEITQVIENFAPKHIAESWDNVGLLIGDDEQEVSRVLLTLDVTDDVINEAIANEIDLIIAHHPNIFKSIKQLKYNNYFQKNYIDLIKNDISVYACHTNVDNAQGGMNDWLCDALGLVNVQVLSESGMYNLNGEQVLYGGGRIGEYEQEISLKILSKIISENLVAPHLKVVQAKNVENIKKVALCGGAGSDFYSAAIEKGADVYLTGDVSYHIAQDIQKQGMSLIDMGHYVEVIFIEKMYEIYENWISENSLDLQVIKSAVNTNPFV